MYTASSTVACRLFYHFQQRQKSCAKYSYECQGMSHYNYLCKNSEIDCWTVFFPVVSKEVCF